MRIQHNIMAMNAYRNYNNNTKALSGNLEKLSSGYKINRAGDDAAGLAISEKMRAQITGLDAAQKNVKDGISLVKTAEGAMQEIQDMLNRMDYLATQSANGTYDNDVDRANLQKEVAALKEEINRIADSANFNGIKLLDGSQAASSAEASTVKVTVTSTTVTAGQVAAGGEMDADELDAKFTPSTNDHKGIHATTETVDQKNAKFTIDIKDVNFVGVSANATAEISIGDNSFTVTIASANAASVNGTAVANGVGSAGVTFNVTVDGVTVGFKAVGKSDGKIEITYATSADAVKADGKADKINEAIFGQEVKVEVKAGTASLEGSYVHGVQDVTKAVDKEAGEMGGISLTLDSDIVAEGNKLTIGNQTFTFKVDADSELDAASFTGNDHLIDVSKFSGDDAIEEAARQMAASATTITDADRNNTTFKISAVEGKDGTIHIDQVKQATNEMYTEDDLKGLFSVTEKETVAANGSITMSAKADKAKINVGDEVTYNGKTYTMNDSSDIDKFNNMLSEDAANNLKAAADKVLSSSDYKGKYTADVGSDGSVTVTAKSFSRSDTKAFMEDIMSKIQKEAGLQVSTLAEENIGKGGLVLQIGDTAEDFNQMSVKIGDMHVKAMGKGKNAAGEDSDLTIEGIDISTQDGAKEAIATIKNAINYVSSVRGDLGAIQNRLEHTGNNLSVMAENIQDAESTIRDTDVADEMMKYVKNNILVQSAQAMLAQANQVPQGVLQLLG